MRIYLDENKDSRVLFKLISEKEKLLEKLIQAKKAFTFINPS